MSKEKAPASEGPQKCPAEGCTKKADRAGYCPEHFTWFKEGLINKAGLKPRDFDKKYQDFIRRNKGQ